MSAFGTYNGNGSAASGASGGQVINIGFLPRMLIIKRRNGSAHWVIYDTFRSGAKVNDDSLLPYLAPNNNEAESSSNDGIENFDLSIQNENILGGQDPNEYLVTYYETLQDAQSGNNALSTNYNNTSNPQQIYARVEHVDAIGSNSGCFSISDFMIVVTGAVPEAISPGEYVICDPVFTSNNQTFDLDSQNEIILEGQNIDSYNITYHISEEDALNGINPLESQYENISNPQTIYVRVEDTNAFECYSTTSFDLVVCLIPEGISPNNDGYNDTFELKGYDVKSLKIYNRYGKLVYSTTNYADNWEGQSSEGNKLPVGTYFYHIVYDENLEKTGWVYINY